ncbi:hypothetical protein D1AOALGA4SA_7449 [Olavius algarvensis Delta 1 endosymbiont]|nr:hypothetical protein D1AOALGA4SA_7449 [Olavius algarvensis Delta 1 endosymbiont]
MRRLYKNRSHSTKPSIPTSSIPSFRCRLQQVSRHSRLTLTWPRGPCFLRQNKGGSVN